MDPLATHAASQPDKLAVIDDRPGQPVINWTFAELDRRANQLGHHLLSLGVDPAAKTKVVWCGRNSAGLLAAAHALTRIGAIGVPLNYRFTADEAAVSSTTLMPRSSMSMPSSRSPSTRCVPIV